MNYRLKFCIFALLWVALGQAARAGTVTATLQPSQGSLGDTFSLAITVEGKLDQPIGRPALNGVDVMESGQSSRVTVINGQMSSTVTYYFSLTPTKPGNFTVPSLSIKVDGQTEHTQALNFVVQAGGGNSNSMPGSRAQAGGVPDADAGDDTSGNSAAKDMPYAFIERKVAKRDPYEGEPVISTVKIFSRVEMSNLQRADKPPAEFRFEEIGQSSAREQVGNEVYDVIVFKEAVIPQKSGEIELQPYQLEAQMVVPDSRPRRRTGDFFSDFFNQNFGQIVHKRLSSQPIKMRVRPLPTENRPKDYLGLVGQFQLSSELSHAQLKQGETATLTITIKGLGLLDLLGQKLDLDFASKVKLYPDKPEVASKAAEDGVHSKRVYKFALVPSEGGKVELGELHIPVFNPATEKFEVLSTNLGSLDVEAVQQDRVVVSSVNGNQQMLDVNKSAVKSLGRDLIDIHRNYTLDQSPLVRGSDWLCFALLIFCPFGAYLAVFGWRYLRSGNTVDEAKLRSSKAYRSFKHEADRLAGKGFQNGLSQEALVEYYRVYREYLGNKFNAHGGALTVRDIEDKFKQAGIEDGFLSQAKEISELMDRLAFSGQNLEGHRAKEIAGLMDSLVGEVEKRC